MAFKLFIGGQTALYAIIRLTNAGSPVTGKTYSNVTSASIIDSDTGVQTLPTASADDFSEITAGAFNGLGFYRIKIPATVQPFKHSDGNTAIAVNVSGADPYVDFGTIDLSTNETNDTAQGAKDSADAASSAVNGVQTTANTIDDTTQELLARAKSEYVIDQEASTMKLIDSSDHTTVLDQYNCFAADLVTPAGSKAICKTVRTGP